MMLLKKFEYEDAITLDTGIVNTSDAATYRLNSLWDPGYQASLSDQTVQNFPMFFSATGPYQNYRVLGAKVKVQFVNIGASTAMILPIIHQQSALTNSDQTLATIDNLTMIPGAAEPVMLGNADGGNNLKTRSFYIAPWIPLGITREQYMTNPDTAGNYGSDPNVEPLLTFQCIGLNTQAIVRYRIKIVYYAQVFTPYQAVNVNLDAKDNGVPLGTDPIPSYDTAQTAN